MNFAEIDAITTELAEVIRGSIEDLVAPLRLAADALIAKNAVLEARIATLEASEPPADAIRETMADVVASVKAVNDRLRALPEPTDPSSVQEMVQDAVSAAVAAMEAPEAPDVAPMIDEAVRVAVEALPPPPDVSGLATKEDVEAVRAAIPVVPEPADLSGFATKADVEALRAEIPSIPEAPDLTAFATKADVEDVRAAIPDVPEAPDLSGFATREDVAGVRSEIPPVLEAPDLSGFATRDDVAEAVKSAIPEAPDLSNFATKDEVAEVRAAIPEVPAVPDLSGFATKDEVSEAVASIRIPEPIAGKAGVGIAEAKLNEDGELIIKRDDGETFNVGKVRGNDGIGFEHMSTDWDGERTLTLSFTRDGRTEVTSMTIPAIIDRGVWREGSYERGDAVSWGGSMFIAQRDTADRPETGDAWRLAVKRGRDGKDFRLSADGAGPVHVGVPKK